MKRGLHLVTIAALAGCKFGGPSGDPSQYIASDSGVADATLERGQGGPGDGTGSPPTGDDVAPRQDAATTGDDAGDASTPDGVVAGGACDAAVAVCDPVHNTGCNALIMQQCDVGTSLTMMPTGNCVFYSGTEAGGACTMSPVNESCPPGHTCVSGACRALCFCNSDCPIGRCCSDTSGPPGFTLCGPCP